MSVMRVVITGFADVANTVTVLPCSHSNSRLAASKPGQGMETGILHSIRKSPSSATGRAWDKYLPHASQIGECWI